MEKIKNLHIATERVKLAIKNGERIILYGDSDLDGIASVVMMKEIIEALGGIVDVVCFPNREQDGYGINMNALNFLKDKSPALFITLDLGTANVEEVAAANSMGFEVIIIDHHNPLLKIPEAKILVNPKLDGNTQDFKELCNGGVVWYFAEEAFENKIPETLGNSLLTLASLASISDMVVQVAYNKEIIEKGLKALEETSRLGLQAFSDIFGKLRTNTQKIISSLNTAESSHFQNASYLLLTSDSFEECETIARELADKMFYKQEQIKSITAEVERRISGKLDELVIFEGDPAWKSILAGSVASVIAAKYRKPCFIFKRMDEESVGSVRSLREGESAVEALKHCAEVLVSYRGHPKAAGFRVKNKNLEKF